MATRLIENFGNYETWNADQMCTIGKNLIKKIFTDKSASKIAVKVLKTDDRGIVDGAELFIYDSYINALEKINQNEYMSNVAVEVFEINYRGYAHMMYKIFNDVCYRRFAYPDFHKYELSTIRYLFDSNMLVFECYFETNE